jgi:uroporphyrinogen decarboxylase
MSPKQRLIAALERRVPDHLPVTTHHVMPYFLEKYMPGASNDDFFAACGLDPVFWIQAHRPDATQGAFLDPAHEPGYLEPRRISSDSWRVVAEPVAGQEYPTTRYSFITPVKTLTMVLQSNAYTSWVSERLVKEKSDIDIIARYATQPLCDCDEVNRHADARGEGSLIRGFVNGFDVYGQPGCWQDACVLFGVEEMIMATFDDPEWVHAFLAVLRERKVRFVDSMKGARYDVIETGGGDASSTVISPAIFDEFVAPYDAGVIAHARAAGQRTVYHTCGGMMPLLERLADLNANALETFTPAAVGGDTNLAEAKRRIGGRVCMIGGFNQHRFFAESTPEETRAEVRRCFAEAGGGGGYILSPSDHFFDAKIELLQAFADEARQCVY